MTCYIDAFPERFRHPKEDEYLFRLLRMRHPDAAPPLDRLTMKHRAGAEKIRTLEQALVPLAEKYLSVGDWEAIDAALLGHTDPMLGAEAGAKYDAMFIRIVNLALQQHRKNMN